MGESSCSERPLALSTLSKEFAGERRLVGASGVPGMSDVNAGLYQRPSLVVLYGMRWLEIEGAALSMKRDSDQLCVPKIGKHGAEINTSIQERCVE